MSCQSLAKFADPGMDVPVLELQRVGCESVELSIDKITTDSLGGGHISLMKIRCLHLAAMQGMGSTP